MHSIFLIEESSLIRDALCRLLDSYDDFEVVGEAASARSAHALIDALAPDVPDVVVLAQTTHGEIDVQAARELLRRNPRRRLLLLGARTGAEHAARGLATGARGYASKEHPATELCEAIRAVARDETYLPPGTARERVDALLRQDVLAAGGAARRHPLDALTPREKEIFDLLARGESNEGIARQLRISINTVETHRAHVLKKLGAHSLGELVRVAARHGLL